MAIGYNINQIQIIYGKTKSQDDTRTMEPLIRRNVTMGFQRRLEESWQLRRTVILLDSWESALSAQDTLTEAGAWICDNVLQFIVDKAAANCLVVIASGRDPQLGVLERVARRVELGPLPQVAVDEYFATVVKDGASPDALAQLAAISHGIPLAMKLLAEGANAGGMIAVRAENVASSSPNSDDVIGLALEKYLEPLPPDTVRQAVRIGAIPHRADKALLVRLGVREQDIPALLNCCFILWDDDKQHFTYHPSVRRHLLRWWDACDPKEYRRLSRIALSWFKEQSTNAVSQQKPSYEFERELLYHQLIEDDVAGFNGLAGAFEDTCDEYAMDRAQGFVTDAVELDQRGILTPEGRQWLDYYQARLKLLRGQEDKGEEAFLALADRAPDRFLQTLATWNLGNLRVDQHRWTEGVRHYHTSLAAFESMGETRYAVHVMLSLGYAYCDLAEASGGLLRARPEQRPGVHRIFHVVQQLPFLAYEGLLRRNRFLPNWYFGTNYQNWIIAYLLTEGAKWYRRVERERHKSGSTALLFETQCSSRRLITSSVAGLEPGIAMPE